MGTQFLLKIKDIVSFGLKEQFWFSHPESDQTGQAPSPTFVNMLWHLKKTFHNKTMILAHRDYYFGNVSESHSFTVSGPTLSSHHPNSMWHRFISH